jgi:hypothetical protein
MEEDRSTDSPRANTPMTEDQIIAATVGERQPLNSTIDLAPYDPAWPSLFTRLAKQIREALGDAVLLLEHVGSTSVPGLSAKPIIDMVLAVADSSDESSYVKPLEEEGYTLRIREPDWYEHRLLKAPEVKGNLHVFRQHGLGPAASSCAVPPRIASFGLTGAVFCLIMQVSPGVLHSGSAITYHGQD